MDGTIVCGVTGSLDGRSAAELARALGERLALRVVLVHVVDRTRRGTEDLNWREPQFEAKQMLDSIGVDVGDDVEVRVVVGVRAEALAQAALEEGADVIVLGSRPVGVGGRKLRCVLAGELEAATSVPVLVVPPVTRRRSELRLAAGNTGTR